MKTEMLILRPGMLAERQAVELPDDGDPKYYHVLKDILRPLIGDEIERVRVYADFEGGDNFTYLDMFVDEAGHLRQPRPGRNEAATAHYRRNWLTHAADPGPPDSMPNIVGTAVLFRDLVWR